MSRVESSAVTLVTFSEFGGHVLKVRRSHCHAFSVRRCTKRQNNWPTSPNLVCKYYPSLRSQQHPPETTITHQSARHTFASVTPQVVTPLQQLVVTPKPVVRNILARLRYTTSRSPHGSSALGWLCIIQNQLRTSREWPWQ